MGLSQDFVIAGRGFRLGSFENRFSQLVRGSQEELQVPPSAEYHPTDEDLSVETPRKRADFRHDTAFLCGRQGLGGRVYKRARTRDDEAEMPIEAADR
jgi:hypothetical protein